MGKYVLKAVYAKSDLHNNNQRNKDQVHKSNRSNKNMHNNDEKKEVEKLTPITKDFIEYRTVRFGLQSYKYQKDAPNFEVDSLEELCDISRTSIIELKKADQKLTFDELINRGVSFFDDITVLENIIKILDNKYSSHFRLEKDFYRQVCHIVNEIYSTFKDEEGKKKQSANSQYILFEDTSKTVQTWISNLQINLESNIFNCKNLLNEYKNLPDDSKVNKVDVIKKLNQYFKHILKTVTYIKYNNLNFENLNKNKDLGELHIQVFKNIDGLINRLEKINNDINQFSTTQEFGRGSFNLKTVSQKQNKTVTPESKLEELGYFDVFNSILNNEEYAKRYNFSVNKNLEGTSFEFNPYDLANQKTILEKLFTYKPKKAKAIVTQHIADYLCNDDKFKGKKDEINSILNWFGDVPKIGLDFKEFIEKDNKPDEFKLEFYPVKFAFDYAIEELAKDSYNPNDSFPRKSCNEYLSKYFKIDDKTENYKTFCSLHKLRDKIRRLKREFNHLDTNLLIVEETKAIINHLKTSLPNNVNSEVEKVENWLNNYKNNYEVLKKQYENRKNSKKYADELKSEMSAIGLYRGSLKTKMCNITVKEYDKKEKKEKEVIKLVSDIYKDIACDYGRTIAETRTILEEKQNTDKIQFFTQIIEAENNKKYILAIKKNIAEQGNLYSNNNSDYNIKSIVSISSKAIKKMLSNPDSYTRKTKKEDEQFFEYGRTGYFDKRKNRYRYSFGAILTINEVDKNQMWNSKEEKKLIEDDSNVNFIRDRLLNSEMSKNQNWNELFKWESDLSNAKTFVGLMQVVDNKGYAIVDKKINKEKIADFVKTDKAYLFPIINQDLGKKDKRSNNNRFTNDFENAISQKDNYRLHPEFIITYRLPAYDQNKIVEDKKTHRFNKHTRYHRFQLNGHFGIEIYPNDHTNTITRVEKNQILKDDKKYEAFIRGFNQKVDEKLKDKPYYYGIDRGLNELATLCVMDNEEKIQDFIVFKKERLESEFHNKNIISKNYQEKSDGKVYRYVDYTKETKDGEKREKRDINSTKQSILDLTNLKVETWYWEKDFNPNDPEDKQDYKCTMRNKDGKEFTTDCHPNVKILVENLKAIQNDDNLKKIAITQGLLDSNGDIPKDKITFLVQYPENSTFVNRLKSLSYIRKLQFQLQDENRRKVIIGKINEITNDEGKELEVKNKEVLEYLFKDNNILQWVDRGVEGTAFAEEKYEEIIKDFKEFFDYVKNIKIENYNDKFELNGFENLKKGIVSNITGVLGYIFEKRKGYIVFEDLSSDKISNEIVIEKEQAKLQGLNMYRDIEVGISRYFEKLKYTPPLTRLQEMNKLHYKISNNGKVISEYKQFGNIRFVSGTSTSGICPNCFKTKNTTKLLEKNEYYFYNDLGFLVCCEKEGVKKPLDKIRQKNANGSDYIICTNCGFCTDEAKKERIPNNKACILRYNELKKIQNGDQNAGYIIALLGAREKYKVADLKINRKSKQ